MARRAAKTLVGTNYFFKYSDTGDVHRRVYRFLFYPRLSCRLLIFPTCANSCFQVISQRDIGQAFDFLLRQVLTPSFIIHNQQKKFQTNMWIDHHLLLPAK